jgi:hypothetical protein
VMNKLLRSLIDVVLHAERRWLAKMETREYDVRGDRRGEEDQEGGETEIERTHGMLADVAQDADNKGDFLPDFTEGEPDRTVVQDRVHHVTQMMYKNRGAVPCGDSFISKSPARSSGISECTRQADNLVWRQTPRAHKHNTNGLTCNGGSLRMRNGRRPTKHLIL